MATNGADPRSGRETRLLVLVVGVAIVVLLLLAQWRFPTPESTVTPSAAPLAGLASRATFDDMSSTMADVLSRVSPLVVVVPIESARPDPEQERRPARAQAAPSATPARPVFATAVRVRRELALLHMPSGFVPGAINGRPAEIVAHDASRDIMLVRVPASAGEPDTLSASVRTFPFVTFATSVEATPVGPTIQPIFLGRADTVVDPRWSHPLVPATVAPGLTPGALVFVLNGRLAGMVVHSDGGPMIVPAPALETLVQALEAGSVAP